MAKPIWCKLAFGVAVLALLPWLGLAAIGLWSEFSANSPYQNDRVTTVVVNGGTVALESVSVTIYDRVYGAQMLAPGSRFSFQFDPGPEGDYRVVAHFADGVNIDTHAGYVVGGISGVEVLHIGPNGVSISHPK